MSIKSAARQAGKYVGRYEGQMNILSMEQKEKDRSLRERLADKEMSSRENIASEDRSLREKIADEKNALDKENRDIDVALKTGVAPEGASDNVKIAAGYGQKSLAEQKRINDAKLAQLQAHLNASNEQAAYHKQQASIAAQKAQEDAEDNFFLTQFNSDSTVSKISREIDDDEDRRAGIAINALPQTEETVETKSGKNENGDFQSSSRTTKPRDNTKEKAELLKNAQAQKKYRKENMLTAGKARFKQELKRNGGDREKAWKETVNFLQETKKWSDLKKRR